jgi:Tfp pilus assembly major pilin PilA
VKILAFLFPAIMVIGILAAVALPAYQSYTKRAKASQGQASPAPATAPASANP